LYHAFIVDFWSKDGSGATKLQFGMLTFLGSELATFGAVFGYYFYIRAGDWSSIFVGTPDLINSLVLVNTAILIASSGTLHVAHVAIREGQRRRFLVGLVSTLLLGAVFIAGQVYEYYEFIIHEGFTLTSGVFASAFFGLTGLHGLHVSLGAVLLGIVTVRALRGSTPQASTCPSRPRRCTGTSSTSCGSSWSWCCTSEQRSAADASTPEKPL